LPGLNCCILNLHNDGRAGYWDLVGNSGNFIATAPLLWSNGASPFNSFLRFSDWLYAKIHRTDSIALDRLMELLFEFLTHELTLDAKLVAETFWRDCQRTGRRDAPNFLKEFRPEENRPAIRERDRSLPKRQSRHVAA
jgi:hypothetical protein